MRTNPVSRRARTPDGAASGALARIGAVAGVGAVARLSAVAASGLLLALLSCSDAGPVSLGTEPGVVVEGLGIPGGIAVIADGEYLIADRGGALYYHVDGRVHDLAGIPATRMSDVYGGLLDVSLHPDFGQNRRVYISYNDASHDLAIARFALRDGAIEDFEVLVRSDEFSIGSRIVWEDADHFFVSFGIGGDPYPDPGPQDLGMDVGKIHRFTADGGIPSDNPVFAGQSAPTSVYSYGHRNPQGLVYDATEQTLYAMEHGPLGGDELNVVEAGGNYGWPLFSHGLNYDNTAVSEMTEEEAEASTTLPLEFWGPERRVAPSGMARVDGAFVFGALFSQDLLRYDPVSDETEVLMRGVGRVRDVVLLPNGELLVSIDAGSPGASDPGRVIRVAADGS